MKLIDIFQKLDESSVNEVHSHDDDYEDCDACNGTGEGRWEGETCHSCHGSGVQEPEHDDDDFDIPDDDFDSGDEESYYEKSIRSRGLEEELAMKHQRDHRTQKFPDTSNSLAKRTVSQAEVPNVAKTADGHPTVKYRTDSTHKAAQTRVEPTITPTIVKRKDADQPIPSFLKKEQDVAEGSQRVDSLVTDALKIMRGPELADAVQALKTVLGDREFSSRRGFYNFYIKQLIDMYGQQGMAEGNKKPTQPEADYGDDYQAMVSRVKKLAGLGPLKTVWDPEKRVYKNVPVAVQPKK